MATFLALIWTRDSKLRPPRRTALNPRTASAPTELASCRNQEACGPTAIRQRRRAVLRLIPGAPLRCRVLIRILWWNLRDTISIRSQWLTQPTVNRTPFGTVPGQTHQWQPRSNYPPKQAIVALVHHINQSSLNEEALVPDNHLHTQFAADCLDVLAKSVESSTFDIAMLNP